MSDCAWWMPYMSAGIGGFVGAAFMDWWSTRIAKVLYRCDYGERDFDGVIDKGKQPYYDDADAVIRELEADYILVPKGHTIARIRSAEKLGLTGDGE